MSLQGPGNVAQGLAPPAEPLGAQANSVQDLTALKAIPPDLRRDQQNRYVEDEETYYAFDEQNSDVDDGFLTITPDDSPATGRWKRRGPGAGGAPTFHGASHSENASDEIFVENLGTVETDTALALMVDGTGGLVFGAPVAATHTLGGAIHTADSLANLNSKITDANLVDGPSIMLLDGTQAMTGTMTTQAIIAGAILSQFDVEANTAVEAAPNAIAVLESRRVFTNEGATAENHHNLPPAAKDLEYSWIVQDADGIQINAAAGDTIRIGDTVSSAGGSIQSAVIGDAIRLVAINATEWIGIVSGGNTWTFNGVLDVASMFSVLRTIVIRPQSGGSLQIQDDAAVLRINIAADGDIFMNAPNDMDLQVAATSRIKIDGTGIGFFTTAPVAKATALTGIDATSIDSTYDSVEEAVLNNVRTRLNELESRIQDYGLLN